MKCLSCGAENPEGKRFCSTCGDMLEPDAIGAPARVQQDLTVHRHERYVEPRQDMTTSMSEELKRRLFGGIAWLIVAFGTFIIAVGYLGVIGTDHDSTIVSLRLIGYGILTYAVAALLFSVRAFEGHAR